MIYSHHANDEKYSPGEPLNSQEGSLQNQSDGLRKARKSVSAKRASGHRSRSSQRARVEHFHACPTEHITCTKQSEKTEDTTTDHTTRLPLPLLPWSPSRIEELLVEFQTWSCFSSSCGGSGSSSTLSSPFLLLCRSPFFS